MSARIGVTGEPPATQTLRDTPGEYLAPAWLPGGQMQTIYAYYLKLTPAFGYRRERWDTPDGDFIDLDWLDGFRRESKLVVLFHGLEGCSRSHYAVSLMNQLHGEGWCGIVPHFRGCGGEINRLHRSYHAADSVEVDWILSRLRGEAWRSALCGGYFARWQYAFEVARRTGRTGSRCGREGVGCVRADSRQTVRLRLEERKSMQPIFSGP